jgi:hypothetical protein
VEWHEGRVACGSSGSPDSEGAMEFGTGASCARTGLTFNARDCDTIPRAPSLQALLSRPWVARAGSLEVAVQR